MLRPGKLPSLLTRLVADSLRHPLRGSKRLWYFVTTRTRWGEDGFVGYGRFPDLRCRTGIGLRRAREGQPRARQARPLKRPATVYAPCLCAPPELILRIGSCGGRCLCVSGHAAKHTRYGILDDPPPSGTCAGFDDASFPQLSGRALAREVSIDVLVRDSGSVSRGRGSARRNWPRSNRSARPQVSES